MSSVISLLRAIHKTMSTHRHGSILSIRPFIRKLKYPPRNCCACPEIIDYDGSTLGSYSMSQCRGYSLVAIAVFCSVSGHGQSVFLTVQSLYYFPDVSLLVGVL